MSRATTMRRHYGTGIAAGLIAMEMGVDQILGGKAAILGDVAAHYRCFPSVTTPRSGSTSAAEFAKLRARLVAATQASSCEIRRSDISTSRGLRS
jgi:hypothetical protein